MTSSTAATKKPKRVTGLRYWMTRVLEECDHVEADFSSDPVHDLRVALRRCRSMADALMAIIPDPNWKKMKKAGKGLFQKLGDLRDTQVMIEWVEKLDLADSRVARTRPERESEGPSPASSQFSPNSGDPNSAPKVPRDPDDRDPASHALLEVLSRREDEQKHEARAALDEFDRKQWRQWTKVLPQRAARFRPASSLFKHLALERWTEARELHHRALRNRSQAAFHSLRIGIKRFRYVVENFLPAEHKAWSDQLKQIQDLLGEVHDLDVLWTTALSCHVFPDDDSRKRWHARILDERTKRIKHYRQMMAGHNALWHVWRKALPQGRQIQTIATQRMKVWAQALDPDFPHSERVTALALELYDGLSTAGLLGRANGTVDGVNPRSTLFAAALFHDVGKSRRDKGHHKHSFRLINEHGAPLGWNPADIKCAAVVARFHQGALPTKSHRILRDLLPDEQKAAMELAAILRLANALDANHDGHIRHAHVESKIEDHSKKPTCIIVSADGYSVRSSTARAVAAERYLLESILRRPVMIKPLKPPA